MSQDALVRSTVGRGFRRRQPMHASGKHPVSTTSAIALPSSNVSGTQGSVHRVTRSGGGTGNALPTCPRKSANDERSSTKTGTRSIRGLVKSIPGCTFGLGTGSLRSTGSSSSMTRTGAAACAVIGYSSTSRGRCTSTTITLAAPETRRAASAFAVSHATRATEVSATSATIPIAWSTSLPT